MAFWKWKAMDDQGIIRSGLTQEDMKEHVISSLRRQSLYPLSIRSYRPAIVWLNVLSGQSGGFWTQTTRKLAVLLESGIPLLTVLEILIAKENNNLVKAQWEKVYYNITAGKDFSLSLSEFVPPPGPFLEAMIKAGENSGSLASSFSNAADQLEEEYRFKQKIATALLYPAILLGVAMIVIYTLSQVVLPIYAKLFDGLGAELPVLSRLLFTSSIYMPYLMAALAIFFIVYRIRNRKNHTHRLVFPGTGQIIRYRELMLFASIFERLLSAGYPLAETLRVMENIAMSPGFRILIQDLKFALNEGRRISSVFFLRPYFPFEAAKMLAVAEESGRLSEMFGHLAKMFKGELQERLERYSRIIEPVLVIGMAGIVGIVAVGVLMPIFEMSTHIR